MSKTINIVSASNHRRNFRLSPLEMLIVALIVLGVLYLITIWVNSLLNQGSANREPQSVQAPLAQVDQLIIATEKATAKLIALEKSSDQLKREMANLKKSLQSSATNKALALRVAKLEKSLARLKPGGLAGGKAPNAALAAKVKALEKAVAQNSQLVTRVKGLEKAAVQEAGLEKSLQALDKRLAANEALAEKVIALEKKTAPDPRLAARLKALEDKPSVDAALAARVTALEKRPTLAPKLVARLEALENKPPSDAALAARLSVLEKAKPTNPNQESRLRNLESGLVGLAQERGDVSRRLDRLEKAVAKRGETQPKAGTRPAAAPSGVENEKLQRRIGLLAKQVAGLEAQVEKLRAAPVKPTVQAAQPKRQAAQPKPSPVASAKPEAKPGPLKLIRHKVRRGDTLYGIARKYNVKVGDLRRWNPKLKGRKYLWVGETLLVYRAAG